MENNQLIKHDGGLIKRVGNAISVTNKLLALTEPQLIPYRKKDKWGFCTPDKKIVIDCVWDKVYGFKEELAIVKLNEKWGFINKTGELVIPCIYQYTYFNGPDFDEGLAKIELNGKEGFINKKGEIILK